MLNVASSTTGSGVRGPTPSISTVTWPNPTTRSDALGTDPKISRLSHFGDLGRSLKTRVVGVRASRVRYWRSLLAFATGVRYWRSLLAFATGLRYWPSPPWSFASS